MINRRLFLLTSAGALLGARSAFAADTPEDQVARNLAGAGFRITSRRRTLLGRVRFLAVRGGTEREVVLDPSSGEILRDYSRISAGGQGPEAPGLGTDGGGEHSGGGEGEGEGGSSGEGAEPATHESASEPAHEKSASATGDVPL